MTKKENYGIISIEEFTPLASASLRKRIERHYGGRLFPFSLRKGVGNMNISFSDLCLFLSLIVNIISLTYNILKKK